MDELAARRGAPLERANSLGQQLMNNFRLAAEKHDVALTVCGFGTAFAIHFTESKNLVEYRDTLRDDQNRLRHFLYRLLEEGVYTLPDGRFYVSVVHTEEDIAQTTVAINRIFKDPQLKRSLS